MFEVRRRDDIEMLSVTSIATIEKHNDKTSMVLKIGAKIVIWDKKHVVQNLSSEEKRFQKLLSIDR
jgi:hypothetical protein